MVIYKITNTLNGKLYIGQTRQPIEKRFLQHSKAGSPLGNAMQDCGIENFTIEVIEECETKAQADERERFWIKALKCKYPNGYNQTDGGAGLTGFAPVRRQQRAVSRPMTQKSEVKIGGSLKRFRKAFHLTQDDVAKLVGLSRPIYTRYEGDKNMPGVDVIIKIADAYDVSVDYLLGRSDDPRPIKLDEKTLALVRLMQETFQPRRTAAE